MDKYILSIKKLAPVHVRRRRAKPKTGSLTMKTFRVKQKTFRRRRYGFTPAMIRRYNRDMTSKKAFETLYLNHTFPATIHAKQRIEKVNEGSFGVIYKVTVTPEFLNDLRQVCRTGFNVFRMKMPTIGTDVAVKVDYSIHDGGAVAGSWFSVSRASGKDASGYIARVTKETMVHASLADKNTPFFADIYISAMEPRYGINVTVSEFLTGVTLDHYTPSSKKEAAKVFDVYEQGLKTMWQSGFAHVDLHLRNAMVSTKPVRVTILDFGRSEKMTPHLHEKVKKSIQRGDHVEEIWKSTGLREWVYKLGASYGFFHPNIRGPRRLMKKLSL